MKAWMTAPPPSQNNSENRAPQTSASSLVTRMARISLARILANLGYHEEIPYPDLSTKAKAQAFIGLEMDALYREKEKFLEVIVPQWEEEAEIRQEKYWQY